MVQQRKDWFYDSWRFEKVKYTTGVPVKGFYMATTAHLVGKVWYQKREEQITLASLFLFIIIKHTP